MSIWGAFANSKSAMIAFSYGMDAISQNIANVSTHGYKRSDVQFKELLSESTAVGDIFGVGAAHRNLISQQGIVNGSDRWSDIALNGEGFFVVNSQIDGSGETLFTRSGSWNQVARDTDGDGLEEGYLTDGNGHYLMGWAANDDGTITTADSLDSLTAVRVERDLVHPGATTTQAQPLMNIEHNVTTDQLLSFTVYDTSANPQRLDMTWRPAGGNNWDMDLSVSGSTNVVPATVAVTFDGDGNVASPAGPVPVAVTWADGSSSTINLDLSTTTQLAGESELLSVDQDGVGPGAVTGFSFDGEGILYGNFDNGRSRPLYKLPVADFRAPDQLEVRNGGLFAATAEAGDLTLRDVAGQTGVAYFVPRALEQSTVDLADEFTRMITTQRAYSSAATVFRTADEMTTLARDLKR